jgi:hypothetical protein
MEYIIERGMRILPESSWRPVLQRSIDAFYEGNTHEGIAACVALLQEPGLPDDIRELTYRNQTFYAQPLADLFPGARWQPLEVPGSEPVCDPSPVDADGRAMVILRATGGADEAVSSEAVTVPTLEGIGEFELVILHDDTEDDARMLAARPFFADGALQIAIVAREDKPGDDGLARAGVFVLTEEGQGDGRQFGPRPGNFARGWSPLVTPDGPRFVDWWEPTEVFRFDAESGEFVQCALRMAPHIAQRFQEGSPGVPVPGGYLFLVNESIAFDNGAQQTYSRFIRIDEAFQITDISPQFFVAEQGQGVATGLARWGDRLVAGFMSGETQSLLANIDLESVLATLMQVDAPGSKKSATTDAVRNPLERDIREHIDRG